MIMFFAQRRPWSNKIGLNIGNKPVASGPLHRVMPLLFETVKQGESVIGDEPTLALEFEEAQALMDELYSVGVRPTEGHGSVGQVAAMKEHLGDMRRLVFRDVPIGGKEGQ
jgi:hypothetical protein